MDGFEAAEYIRKTYNGHIIFLTGYSTEETLGKMETFENAKHLVKPYDSKKLSQLIDTLLKMR